MGLNLLIVDDSSIVRKVFRRALDMTDVQLGSLFEAENGQQALEILEREWIDLIFLDINMPVMNGIEFLSQLRQSDQRGTTPVIIVSTEGSRERKEKIVEQGISGYLRKPVSPEELVEAIHQVLGAA